MLVFDTDLVEEAPIVDLRVRKARRRNGVNVVVASSHPTTLDANADAVVRFAPGGAEAALQRRCVANGNEHLRRRGSALSWSSGASASRTAPAAARASRRCSRSRAS